MLKKTLTIIGLGITVYIGIFTLWFALMLGCIAYEEQHGAGYCGGDVLTKVARALYSPIIGLIN